MPGNQLAFLSQLVLAMSFLVQQPQVFCSASYLEDSNPPTVSSEPESPQERNRGPRDSGKIYRNRVAPNWIDGTSAFWYRNDLPQGGREFILVDAERGKRELAFDHEAVAKSIGPTAKSTHLPIERLDVSLPNQPILIGNDKSYRWDSQSKTLSEVVNPPGKPTPRTSQSNGGGANGSDSSITFENRTKSSIEIFWLSDDGSKQSYGKIEAGSSKDQHTFGGHRWQIVNAQGESLGVVTAQENHSSIVVDGRPIASNSQTRRRPTGSSAGGRDLISPDGKWQAMVQDHNVILKRVDSDERSVLTKDGTESNAYGQLSWSPDSQTIVAFREKSVEKQPVHRIRSSPPDGGRAKLETSPYVLPGDPFPIYELNLLRVETGEQIKPTVDPFEHEWLRPRIRFHQDGSKFTYEQ
ncbi:MAG: DPP IV N-terminal domain-containing protein, partial [Pirellula staleyi]